VRIAHFTDVHWFCPPPWRRMSGKRLLGTFNLYALGRRHHFNAEVQAALVTFALSLEPDLVIISGDLTAQALPEEFKLALNTLDPLLQRVPSMVLPGNHDVYTRGSAIERRFEHTFGPWTHREPSGLARLDMGNLSILGLDPCRPHWSASGRVPQEQLQALADTLGDATERGRTFLLALHYPILDRRGKLYNSLEHGLRNAADLVEVLRRAPIRPVAIVHGHKHHGYRVNLDLGDAIVPIFNPGAGGYTHDEHHDRAACMNLLNLANTVEVERFRWDGSRFLTESGGAYATGR